MGCDTFGIDVNVGFKKKTYVFNELDAIYLLLMNNIIVY